jgi:RHS repeat-associated protein
LTACQSGSDSTLDATGQTGGRTPVSNHASLTIPHPPILNVFEGPSSGEIDIQFGAGVTPAIALASGHEFGLQLVGGPMISGPLPSGMFAYTAPQPSVEAVTPTTALVYFPDFTKAVDRRSFLVGNHLQVLRWFRPDNGFELASVKLPPSNLHPQLLDPVHGLFQISLPGGLTTQSVIAWAIQAGLKLISYTATTGVTVVRPATWLPPVRPAVRTYPRPATHSTPVPAAVNSPLYTQFDANVASSQIKSIASGLGLTIVGVSASNLVTFSVTPGRVKAEIQLLSDLAGVQCVNASPTACMSVSAAPATASSPVMQSFAQPAQLNAQLQGGILRLSWRAASGASAYGLFAATAANGPYALMAVVAGQNHTSLDVFELTPPGQTAYYFVEALRPCTTPTDSPFCDQAPLAASGSSGASTSWSNPPPVTPPTPNTGTTDPTASPAPTPSAEPAPPAQTIAGPTPQLAPSALEAVAADGHVILTWAPVTGAASYRIYRAVGGEAVLYIGQTSSLTLTDVMGTAGIGYRYEVAAVSPAGLVGTLSSPASVTWAPATTTPSVLRSMPAEASPLAGRVRFEVDAASGSGRGSVEWRITGPASAVTIGTAPGVPSATSPLSWSAALSWDTANLPDGTYSVSATVTDADGPQVTTTSHYRFQNGAPIGPGDLTAIAHSGGVALTWDQPSTATGTTYRIFRDQPLTGTALVELSADARSYLDASATVGQHVYQVALIDAAGHMSAAAAATITVSAPSTPATTPPLDVKLLLPDGEALAPGGRATGWLTVVAPAVEGLHFELSSDGTTWRPASGEPRCGDVCEIRLDLGALAPGAYLVRGATANAVGAPRSFTRAEAVRYSAPGAVTGTEGPLGVTLSWSAPAASRPGSYIIERRVADGDWHVLDQVVSRSYIDFAAPAGGRATYRIIAVDTEGNGGQASSDVAVAVPDTSWAQQEVQKAPPAPAGLTVFASHGRSTLRWQHVAGSDSYAVERQAESGGPFARVAVTATESFTEAPALSTGRYSYRVVALNGSIGGPASDVVSAFVVPSAPPLPISDSNSPPAAPSAPTAVKTAVQSGEVTVTWTATAGTAQSATYNVYRMNPATGVFTEAVAGVRSTTFVDSALPAGTSFGYVVTAADTGGRESSYSMPAWSAAAAAGSNFGVKLALPAGPISSALGAPNLTALAEVTAAAGLAGISFAISSSGGSWRTLPLAPIDPRSPSAPAVPLLAAGASSLWGSTLNMQSLAPGTYEIRVQARDRAGRTTQQIQQLDVVGSGARGPPSSALAISDLSSAVHLSWTATGSTYTIQRSLFGPDGPFEAIGTTQASQFDDLTAIPGRDYSYRVIGQNEAPLPSPMTRPTSSGTPSLQLGPVSAAGLSVTTRPVQASHPLYSTLHAIGQAFEIDATSLATGAQVHHLAETAQLRFALPAGTSTVDSSAADIYHWDDATASWVSESGVVDPDSTAIVATLDHLSQFILATSNASSHSTNPGPPSTALTQPAGSQGPPSTAQGKSWADLPVNPDGEVPALRTESSSVFRTDDGGFTQVIGLGRVNYKDAGGSWQKIDTTLIPDGAGGWRNAAGPLSVDLPSTAGPIRVDSPQGSMTMSIRGAASIVVEADSTSATYRSLFPGIDVAYDVTRSGLNENIAIGHRPNGPIAITYDLSTDGLVLSLRADGSVTATSAAGVFAFTLPAPWMMETPNGQQLAGAPSTRVGVTLTGSMGHYALTYTPDLAWLQDPGRRYPVVLDPSLTITYEVDNAFNSAGSIWGVGWSPPTYDFPVGYDPNGYLYRWIMEFDSNESYAAFSCTGITPPSCYASSAYLTVYEQSDNFRDPSGTGTEQFKVWPSQAHYNPGINIGWQQVPIALSPSASIPNPVGSGAMTFNITSIVQQWETTNSAGSGVLTMVGRESGSANSDIYVYSGDNGTYYPRMTIYYPAETITSSAPDPITVQPGAVVNIPVRLTNPSSDYTWHASDLNDLVRLGVASATIVTGAPVATPSMLTFLPSDVGPSGTINTYALIQAPLDPGDYWYTVDLRRDLATYPSAANPLPFWFSTICGSTCNTPVTVHVRVVAPGDQQAASVPVTVGDGSTASVNSSNGSSTLSATDLSIAEPGDTALTLTRTYNSVNGSLPGNSTGSSSSTYGVGWTYSFQRNVQLGTWASSNGLYETDRFGNGLYTDASGKTWPLVWNPGRGVWEDAAGGRTVSGPIPADLVQRNGNVLQSDVTAPFGHELYLSGSGGTIPSALIFQAGSVPTLPGGSIEVWFKPDVDMLGESVEYTMAADSKGYFIINWNGPGHSHQWCFSVYNKDLNVSTSACSSTVNWTHGTWHQIVATWSVPGTMVKTLYLDGAQAGQYEDAGLSPMGDLYFGYHPQGAYAILKGAIAGLRIDASVLSLAQVQADFAAKSETAYATTLFLGTFVNSPNSALTNPNPIYSTGAPGYDVLTSSDQSQEVYDPGTGRLVAYRDRVGNQIDYSWDTSGRIATISDHSLANRALKFCYPDTPSICTLPSNVSFRVIDFINGGRTVDYTVNNAGDLVDVVKSNAVPDPLTGVLTQQPFATAYGYAAGHLLQTIVDPRGSRTRLNYDTSYAQAVMADVPSNYWRLGDTNTQLGAADAANPCTKLVLTTCNGTYSGGVTLGQRGVAFNDANTSTAFDGSSGSLALTGTAIPAGAPYTIEGWVKQTVSTGVRVVVGFAQGVSSSMLWLNGGIPTFRVATASSYVDVPGSAVLNGAWHHIAGSYDGVTARLYVDGQLVGTPTTVASGGGGTAFWIGSQNGAAGTFLAGNLDEVALYPASLAGARLQAHYIAGRLGVGASATGYAANVIADSPVGFWRLSEPGGNLAMDQSGFAGTGTYYGGYMPGGSMMPTDPARSTYFNGTAYVTLPTYSITNAVTVEAWVYASTYNQSGFIVGKTPVNQNWELFVYNNVIYWRTGGVSCGTAGSYTDLTTPAPSVNMWHHIVAVENGTTGQIFIDGSLVASSSAMDVIGNTTYPVEIGRFGAYGGCGAGYYFTGSIGNVAVYSAALSSVRVLAHYTAAKAPPPTGSPYPSAVLSDSPAGYWRLGETGPNNQTTAAQDISGNGLTGTYTPALGYTLGQPGALGTDPGFSARFNGTSGFVSIGNPISLQQIYNGTIEAWVYTTTTAQSSIAAKYHAWWFGVQTTGKLGFYDMTAGAMRDSGVVVNDGRWHHVAVTFKSGLAGQSQMYVDGVPAGAAFLMTVNAQANIVELAGYEATTQFLNGWEQDVAIYPTVLSPNRLMAHYQAARVYDLPLSTPSSYAANVAYDSPSGYWRLDDPSGSTAVGDVSGMGNAGTISGGVTLGVAGSLANDNDTAAAFDGTSGYVNVPDNSALFSTVLSVEAWVKANAWVAGGTIINRRTSGNVGGYIIEPANTSGQINFYVYAGGAWRAATSAALTVGVWHHLVGTYDGATVRIYVDGVLSASTAYAGSINNPASPFVWIGRNAVNSTYFNGSIDEVAIYGTTLSAARVAAHYAAGSAAQRVLTVQDARGTTASSFQYSDDVAMTQLTDGLGQVSYYTFQHAGGRTVSYQDPLGNLISYGWNGRSAFQLDGTLSPGGILDSSISNSLAPVGQQSQSLITEKSNQPPDQIINYVAASTSPANWLPAGAAAVGTWTWDLRQRVLPGVPSHSSPFVSGTTQQHQAQFASSPILVPSGATLTQWVYFQAGVNAPTEIMLQLHAQDGTSAWEHRAYWGANSIAYGTDGTAARRVQSTTLPLAGHWVALTIQLGPILTSAGTSKDVGMEGHMLDAIAFDVYSNLASGGGTYWGPTILDFPPATAPATFQHQTSTFAYDQYNDQVASVDPNGIAQVTDYDANGFARQASSGLRAPTPPVVFEDPLQYPGVLTNPWVFEKLTNNTTQPSTASGTGNINGFGTLTQTQADNASASDLYRDVTGLRPGTYARVSVWVSMHATATPNSGGAQLWVDDGLLPQPSNGTDSPVQRQGPIVQPATDVAVQLSLPFLVDQTGRLRIHLVHMNFNGSTTWADVRVEDITPVPDVTLQGPRTVYMADFEQSTDRSAWTLTAPSGGVAQVLSDGSRSHGGGYNVHLSSPTTTASGSATRAVTLTPGYAYRVSAWVKTIASGSNSETSGAGAQLQLTSANGTAVSFPRQPVQLRTNGQWRLLSFDAPQVWYGAMTLKLSLGSFAGDVYFDDVTVEQVGAEASPIALVQQAGASGTSPLTVTLPAATVAGDLLVATVQEQAVDGAGATAPANWVKIEDSEFKGGTSIWYLKNAPGGLTSFQFTSGAANKMFVEVSEWSGADTLSPLDVHAYGSLAGPSLTATASVAGATGGELAVTAFTEQGATGNTFTRSGVWSNLGSNANFGAGNLASGTTDYETVPATGLISELATSSAAPAGSNWDWVIASFKPQAVAGPATNYWFSFTDKSLAFYSAVDVHVFNPGPTPALGAILIPGQASTNVNVAPGADANYSLKTSSWITAAQLDPIRLVMQSPVIASLRTQTSAGGFNEVPAQQGTAAAPTLFLSYYDSTVSGTSDYIHLINPGTQPVTGFISMSCVSPNWAFSIAPGGEQAIGWTSKACGPITIQASGPILASQRVYLNGYSEVPAQAANAASTTVYFANAGNATTATFEVVNPAFTGASWSLTATVPGSTTQSFPTITTAEQSFTFNATANGPVIVTASVPVLASARLNYATPVATFIEFNGTTTPATSQYFNWYDSNTWVSSDSIQVGNPSTTTTATGTIVDGARSINVSVGPSSSVNYPFPTPVVTGGPVIVSTSVPVVVSQKVTTTQNYRSEIPAQTVPASGAPGAPTSVVAIPGNTQATVLWSAPVSSGTSAISSYRVMSSTGVSVTTPNGTTTSAVFTNLANNSPYTFSVVAINASGQGPWSSPSSALIPGTTSVSLPASAGWQLVTSGSGSAAASYQPTAGVANGAARVITIATTASLADVKDVLSIGTLRAGAGYVISAWVSATAPGTVDFSLRDGSGNALAMDQSTMCQVTTTPSLCEGSLTYSGADYQPVQLTLLLGGQGQRTVAVSHPLVALSAERRDFTSTGQPVATYDVFGHLTRSDYDSQGLYMTDTVQRMAVDYHQTVLADSPLAYWSLEDGSGSAAVDLAGNHPLAVSGSLAGAAVLPSVPGVSSATNPGGALSVASSSSILSALSDANGQSIEMWVSLSGIPNYNDSVFALTGTGTGHLDRWNGDGTPYPAYFETVRHHFNVQVPTTGVHYIVYTRRTGGRYRLYLDGVLVGDDPAGIFGVPSTLYLGGNGVNLSMKGNLADVALYNSELTATQVQTHYQVGMGQLDLQPPSYGDRERASYSATVAADAPAAYWRLGDAGTPKALDASGHGATGTYSSSVTVGPGALVGDTNSSAVLDGSSGAMSAIGPVLATGATLEAWVKGTGAWSPFTETVVATSANDSLAIVNGHPYAAFSIGGTSRTLDAGVAISIGAWHHLATTWDGYTIRIYIDGALAAFTASGAGGLSESGNAQVGGFNGANFFNGALDEVAVYGSALSPGRILAHYWAGAGQVTATAPSYSGTVLGDHPAGYWQLTDSSGTTAVDASGNSNNGTLSGGVTLNQPGATADGANAMSFDGSTGIVTIGNAAPLNSGSALTMEGWVYLPAAPTQFTNLIDKATFGQYRLGVDTVAAPKISLQVTNGSLNNYVDNCPGKPNPASLSLNQWHHLVGTFDGTAGLVTMYVDAVRICQSGQTNNGNPLTAYNTIPSSTYQLILGRDTGGTGYLNGKLHEVAVYSSALSAAQVRAHFVAAHVNFPNRTPYSASVLADQPAGYWRLGEGQGVAVADSTGLNNIGVLTGGVTLGVGGVSPDGGSGAAFDGSTGIVTINNSGSLNPSSALTMEAWVFLPVAPAQFTNLIDKASYGQYRLGVDPLAAPKISLQVTNGSLNNYVDNCPGQPNPASLSLNQWHHLAATFDGAAGLVTMYVDGVQICQSGQTDNGNPLTAYNAIPASAYQLIFGRDTGGTGYLNGKLDEVAVYGTAVTTGRILAHYQASILGGRHLVTGIQQNALGQRTATVKFNGRTPAVDQFQLDSWGRLAREIQNSSTAPADAQTNVVTGLRYDANGNLVDTYEQAPTAGQWVDSHTIFDANNNQLAEVQNCTGGSPCGVSTQADQNVVTAYAYDALNRRTDSYTALPGCITACVPMPTCSAALPITCAMPATPCPTATCIDDHTVYDPGGRTYQEINNYGGGQSDPSQVNLTTTYTYDADGKLLQTSVPITGYGEADPYTLQTGFIVDQKVYDAIGQQTGEIRGAGAPTWMQATPPSIRTDYMLDAGGRKTSVTGPGTGASSLRVVAAYDFDDLGRVLSVTEDWGTATGPTGNLNATSRTVYDPRGPTHSFSPPTQQLSGGLETTTNDDLSYHAVAVIRDDALGGLRLTSTTLYDALGRSVDVIDPRGIDTHTAYDALNRAIATTANYCPSGSPNPNCIGSGSTSDQNVTSSSVFDPAGNQIQSINARVIVGYTTFDALGREVTMTADCTPVPVPPSTSCGAAGFDQNVTSSQSYDQAGNVLTTTDPLLRKNVFTYDALGRKASETVHCVNATGQCDAGMGPANDQNLVTTWQVDAQGDVLQERSPRQWTDGQKLTTAYYYDALLRLIRVAEDQSQTLANQGNHQNLKTDYTYDPSGDMLTQRDGLGNTTSYTIDHLGRTYEIVDAGSDGRATNTVRTYLDVAGEALGTWDQRNMLNTNAACTQPPETVCYTLDRLGRVVTVSYLKSDGTARTQSFTYDADGNRASFADTDVGQTTIAYDHLNRVSVVTSPAPVGTPNPLTTTYTYNADGAVTAVSDPVGAYTYNVDRLDRPSSMVDPVTGGTTTYTVDAAGRLTQRTEANGIVTTPTYNGVDQLASKTEVLGAGTLAQWTNVSYDPAQNRTAETLYYPNNATYPDPQSSQTTPSTYQYDSVDQLVQAAIPNTASTSYAYDLAHNLTTNGTTAQTYFNNESLNLVGAVAVHSDGAGNELFDASGHALTWNALSQLESFAGAGGTESYTYDALGRLTTISLGASITRQFVYRGLADQLVKELDGSGNLVRSYAWDSAGRQLYAKVGATAYYEITNPHGDVAALASASGLAGTEHFDAWGNVLSASNSVISPAWPIPGFTMGFQGSQGSWTDSANGFVYMAARWYYPKVARFLSSDPAAGTADPRTPMGRDRWLYGVNDPLIHSDPTGLNCSDKPCGKNFIIDPEPPVAVCDAACEQRVQAQAAARKKAQHKQQTNCAWYDAVCKAKQALEAAKKVASDAWNYCKNSDVCKTVAPIAVSLAVGLACTAVTAGAGALGCAVLAGAVSGALSGALECKSGESIGGCMATGAAVGAITGLAGYGVGKLISIGARAAVGALGRTGIGRAVASGASRALGAVKSGASRAISAIRSGASDAVASLRSGASRVLSAAARSGASDPGSEAASAQRTVMSRAAINGARRQAVRQAWRDEREMVRRTGSGTRDWTKAEEKELLTKGKVRGYQGHHINSVDYSLHTGETDLISDPNNIRFLNATDHLAEHGGNWQNWTEGELLDRAV